MALERDTEAALYDEGKAMAHCVATWVGDCLLNDVHVFSIRERRSKVRLATLALQADDALGWHAIQVKGRRNSAVTSLIEEFAGLMVVWLEEHLPARATGSRASPRLAQ